MIVADRSALTPTLRRMLDLLSDGEAHVRDELRKCCNDDMATDSTVADHLSNLRALLPPGVVLVCHHRRPAAYQLLRRIGRGE